MEITTGGWMFLIVSWSVIIGLNVFCFYNIFKQNNEKIVDTIDIEAKIDEIDPS
jgi:low affinity Fe/Cu permease